MPGNNAFVEKPEQYMRIIRIFQRDQSSLVARNFLATMSIDTRLNLAAADLIQFTAWDSNVKEQRQEMLAALARKVWQIHEDSNEEVK